MIQVKQILAHFLKVEPSEINELTKIGYQVFHSSLMMQRMYGKLAADGYVVSDPSIILTYDDLIKQLATSQAGSSLVVSKIENVPVKYTEVHAGIAVGVDTELIANFDFPQDVRGDMFYKKTFSLNEIEYALNKVNPQATFAALFSLKEAIVKADNNYIGRPFCEIEISHTPLGKPVHAGFSLSASHSDIHVVAIAIKMGVPS
jgi:phosphopantetheine--protein transferase-like protein